MSISIRISGVWENQFKALSIPLAHLAAWIWNWKWLILGKILLAYGCCYISKNESWVNTWQLLGVQNAAVNQFRCRMLSFSSCKQPFGFAKDITFWKNSSGISWVVPLRSSRIISCLVGDFYKPSPVLLGRGTTQRMGLSSAKPKNIKTWSQNVSSKEWHESFCFKTKYHKRQQYVG